MSWSQHLLVKKIKIKSSHLSKTVTSSWYCGHSFVTYTKKKIGREPHWLFQIKLSHQDKKEKEKSVCVCVCVLLLFFFAWFDSLFFFSFIFISWRLITSQHCSGFCHTLTWISHGVTCIPHPNPPSRVFITSTFSQSISVLHSNKWKISYRNDFVENFKMYVLI